MRPVFEWNIGSRVLTLGKRTLLMGILNVTPDSFSDGGQFQDCERAVAHALLLLDQGADIIDVGGESTRPGARVEASKASASAPVQPAGTAPTRIAVSEEEERHRVLPVIRELKRRRPDALISIDTYKANVARAAVEAGAEIVNDVSAFRWDRDMAKTVAELRCGTVLMHMRGRPEEWRTLPPPGDIVTLVKRELREWADTATLAGVKRERIVLDPGFGFGKRLEHNVALLTNLDALTGLGFPILVGLSRKGMIGALTERPVGARATGSAAAALLAVQRGAAIVRAHDVAETVDALRMLDAVENGVSRRAVSDG